MEYLIASLKHTGREHEHITWWGRLHRGYTPVVGDYVGRYCFGEAADLNDGYDYIAVPWPAVQRLLVSEPYFKPGARLYDQRGPVVNNTRAMWNRLDEASIATGRMAAKIKPEVFRGRVRTIKAEEIAAATP